MKVRDSCYFIHSAGVEFSREHMPQVDAETGSKRCFNPPDEFPDGGVKTEVIERKSIPTIQRCGSKLSSDFECVQCRLAVVPPQHNIEN
jgi:hypothetical protein